MRFALRCLGLAVFLAASGPAMAAAGNPAADPVTPESQQTFLNSNCMPCHSPAAHSGGVVLDKMALLPVGPHADLWERVVHKLQAGEMPPAYVKKRPDPRQIDTLVTWLIGSLDKYAITNPDSGRPVLRRMTRAEYSNAVRDLLAIDVAPGDDLPPDMIAYSFNNNGDALSLSPLLLDKYLRVARQVARLATSDPSLRPALFTYPTGQRGLWAGRKPPDIQSVWHDGVPFGATGGPSVDYYFPATGDYAIRAYVDSTTLALTPSSEGRRIFRTKVHVAAGMHSVAAMVAAENALPEGPVIQFSGGAGPLPGPIDPLADTGKFPLLDIRLDGKRLQRFEVHPATLAELETPNAVNPGMPVIRLLEVEGPLKPDGTGASLVPAAKKVADTPSRARIFVCHPASVHDETPCANRILTSLLRHAYRRDVTAEDVAPFLALYRKVRTQGDFEGGIREALQAILISPKFLFRIESDPQAAAAANYRIDDFELATRLSFFLWSSIPDDRLLAVARDGQLHKPAVLTREVRRMLADRKASALVDNFGMQFLGLQDLDSTLPDGTAYPDFRITMRDEFKEETRLFLQSIFRRNHSIIDLVNANYSYLNEDLAKQYGIPGVTGDQFRRVDFTPGQLRGGVLTQGSVLMMTSHVDITSPVLRGKWVLTNLLNAPPPPPPPGVPAIVATDRSGRALTGREQLEMHRKAPLCASCHTRMDPFGLSLENFDVTGRWRLKDEAGTVNAAVTMPDGSGWSGVAGLKQRLASHPEQMANAFAGRLMIYALGRHLEAADQPTLRAIVRKTAARGYRFDDLVMGVIDSVQFQMRRKPGNTITASAR